MKNLIHVPNHQPVNYTIIYLSNIIHRQVSAIGDAGILKDGQKARGDGDPWLSAHRRLRGLTQPTPLTVCHHLSWLWLLVLLRKSNIQSP